IVLADDHGRVALWSPSMERMTGVSAAEAAGKQVGFLLRGRGLHGEAVSVDVAGEADTFDLELIFPDGQVRWLHGRHGRGQAADGSMAFDVIVVNDVTRRREVDRLKSDFISTVSHELRTPLTPIKGFAALLLRRGEELPAARRREALSTILDHTEHLGRLVEDLLLASTMSGEGERRMPALRTQPVSLAAVLEKTQRTFRASRPHRELIVSCEDGARAIGDSLRVEQILANLVSNAFKFSDDGTPVTVEARSVNGEAIIEVHDLGRGIPADKTEEIFERFKRLEDPLVMETGGAGLGLYIARKLARGMSGDVRVESEPGRGSTFRVHLPRAASEAGRASVAG
ncbi:MAG TPA: ATP-binding protein, partial [Actinomycetota bacterium]|nr:ATP-binding protein [Actinomycetota bacterium]